MLTHKMSRRRLIIAAACAAGIASGATLAFTSGAPGGSSPIVRDSFAVFRSGAPSPPDARLVSLADDAGAATTDRQHSRVLGSDLGEFHSSLVALPARDDHNLCYALLGATREDPGMSYCYTPGNPDARVGTGVRGEHFSVVALESVVDGTPTTQVFGVADDSVQRIRVDVGGTWHDAQIVRNGFYLDLPGVAHADVGIVEATLADGTTKVHNVQTGM